MSVKNIQPDKRMMDALRESIKRWEMVVKNSREDIPECRLCEVYNGRVRDNCSRCPICIDTGEIKCRGTVFYHTSLGYYGGTNNAYI